MTVNDINSKINLPAYCADNGITGFEFKKLPTFGWFAYTKNYDQVNTLFDFIGANKILAELTYLIKEKKNLHEFRLVYSETCMSLVVRDFLRLCEIKDMHSMAMEAYRLPKASIRGNPINLYEELHKQGQAQFLQTQPGLLTPDIINNKRFTIVNVPRQMSNKTIIPTYCAPGKLCSLEVFDHDNALKRQTLFLNGEKGWIGKDLKGIVTDDIRSLQWKEGIVWESKADHWINNVMEIDGKTTVPNCLTIWREAKNTKFKSSPLDIIEIHRREGEIPQYLRELSQGQVAILEKRFSKDFLKIWKNQNIETINIGHLEFTQKDNHYYISSKNHTDEFANFTVHIEKIIKRGGLFFRIGHINYENHVVPFELEHSHFLSSKGLAKKIGEIMFEQGVGIPIIYNAYQSYLIDVINRFNRGVLIETADS